MDYPKSKAVELRLVGDKFADRAGAVKGSVIPAADWCNPITDEILAAIVEGGLVPTEGENTQLRDAIQAIIANNPSVPRGAIDGLILSNNGTVALDISAGIARDDGDAASMALVAALTNKQLNVAWAVGSAAGMLDTGAIAATTWYHIWLIRRSDTGVVDVLASLSATAPTMPANYDQKRRIGAILTDATPDIIGFTQYHNRFIWDARVRDVSTTTPGITAQLPAISVPTGVVVEALLSVTYWSNSTSYMVVTGPGETDVAASDTNHDFYNNTASSVISNSNLSRFTNASGQIRYRGSDGTVDAFHIMTLGWIDPRGRNS